MPTEAEQIEKEAELRTQIEVAKTAGDYDTVRELMLDLIELQNETLPVQLTNEELAEYGIDLLILGQERELREKIKQANQDGKFEEATDYMRELLGLQKLQPRYTGVRMRQ